MVALGAMALGAALAVPAAATGGTGPASEVGMGSASPAVVEAAAATDADPVRSAVDQVAGTATELARMPGYAGVAVDYPTATVTLSWKGPTPTAALRLQGAAPRGVTVTVRRAAFSEAELRAASTRLLDGARAEHGPDVVLAAYPTPDHSGLVAEVAGSPGVAPHQDLTRQDLTRYLERAAQVPVRVTPVPDGAGPDVGSGVESTAADRRDDRAPWHGGGAIATADGSDYCTTGFAIVTGEGARRLVTAAHCNARVGDVVRDGAGQRLGTVAARAPQLDAQLIDPVGSPKTAPSVFGGPWDADRDHPRYRYPVAGVQLPAVGQHICSSGAVTGEHCATIRATNLAWTCGDETCHGFRASRDDGGVVVGGGDSGGPMYVVIDGKAYARGMIDGGSDRRSCGSTSLPTQCFSYVYGIPMVDILEHWDARLDM
ncbi:hypothetical protein GCM10010102_17700 [Promicromonospora citrea]|uniref:Peptidase S1 domain-containing protein n=1 Tax=Promicromonospora citrea TaxID=43677 RepID=A0A8H9L2X7_9MICO|nr:hypothetical protein GCM10010102_17700 [Promicromonospora citrea]